GPDPRLAIERVADHQIASSRELLGAELDTSVAVGLLHRGLVASDLHRTALRVAFDVSGEAELVDGHLPIRVDGHRVDIRAAIAGGLQALGIANDDTALGLGFDGEDPQLELVAVLPTQPGRIAPLSDHRLPDALGTGILDKSALLQAAVD